MYGHWALLFYKYDCVSNDKTFCVCVCHFLKKILFFNCHICQMMKGEHVVATAGVGDLNSDAVDARQRVEHAIIDVRARDRAQCC